MSCNASNSECQEQKPVAAPCDGDVTAEPLLTCGKDAAKEDHGARDDDKEAGIDKKSADDGDKAVNDDGGTNADETSSECDEDAGGESNDDEDDDVNAMPQPNLRRTRRWQRAAGGGGLQKSEQFRRLEATWPGAFRQRMAVPYGRYHELCQLGRVNWAEWALAESEATMPKGHHAVCPLVRSRKTGRLYRCKIVSCSRVHFNLTTLGFKANEFEREIRNCLVERRLLFALEHPFVRSGLGFFTDQCCNFGVLLEEFPHGTLLDYYEKDENNRIVCRFEEDAVRMIAAQVILALEYLHCLGCVHRDIQAANMLLDARGYIKLTDFAITAATEPGDPPLKDVTCFRYYAAPEYFSGNGYGCPVDFYALGLVLYELLCRQCFSDQEDVFDADGRVDWGGAGVGASDESMTAAVEEEHRRKLTQQLLDAQAILGQPQSTSAAKSAAAAAPLPPPRPAPSRGARAFVSDCLLCEPGRRPDRHTARFYGWFAAGAGRGVDFDRLFARSLELPWRPQRRVSYQPDVDEEYPVASVLEQRPVPPEFEPYKELF